MVDDGAQNSFSQAVEENDQTPFQLKGLDSSPLQITAPLSSRQAAWNDNLKFLTSIRQKLFDSDRLPDNYTQREVWAPQLITPTSRAAGNIYFGISGTDGRHDDLLFIEDVLHLVYQVWQAALTEKTLLDRKHQTALANSQSGEDAEAWKKRADELGELLTALKTEIKPLQTYVQKYDFNGGSSRISRKTSSNFLEFRREQSHGGEFRSAIDDLIGIAAKLAIEAGLDVKELPAKTEAAETAAEEQPEETAPVDATKVSASTPAEPAENEPEISGDETTENTKESPTNPNRPLSPQLQPEELQPDYAAQATNNLKIITLETERLTRIYLGSLAALYDLPPELLQDRNPIFRDVVREDIRSWLMSQLKEGREGWLDALYDPTKIREHQMLIQQAVDHLKATFEHDKRLELFSDVLLDHFKDLNSNPQAQAAFKTELAKGKFTDPKVWEQVHDHFIEHMLDSVDGNTATNPAASLRASVKAPHSALAGQIIELGLKDLNFTDNPGQFNEKLTNIVNLIDIMAFGDKPPIFLSALGKTHFEATFKLSLSEAEFKELVPILQTYWAVRVRYFEGNNVALKYLGEGLDPDDIRYWFSTIPNPDKEEFYRNYLARLEHFAEASRSVGDFHRVILSMAPKQKAGATGAGNVESGEPEPDTEIKETAVKALKLQVMHEAMAFVWVELPDAAKRTLYDKVDPSQTEEWLKSNYFPENLTFNELDSIAQYADKLNLLSPSEAADRAMAGDSTFAGAGNPIGQAASQALNAGRGLAKWQKLLQRNARQNAKKAARQAVVAGEKATAETALNSIGSALGLPPGLGTALVELWYKLPEELRPVIAFLLVTGPLALLAGAGGFLLSLLSGQGAQALSGLAGSVGSFFKNLFGGGKEAVSASSAGAQTAVAANSAKLAAPVQTSLGAQIARVATGIHPATQAILITIGATGGAVLLNYMVVTTAFLANFPLPNKDPLNNEKISKYLSVEKQVVLPPDCDQASMKCPDLPAGKSRNVTYNITITSKSSATVSITHVKDELTTKYSKKAYEDKGLPVPSNKVRDKLVIPLTEAGSRSDFPELSPDPNDERNIIRPGETLTITYTEAFDSSYNDSSNANIFRADFYYIDGANSGTDYVQTAKQFCIGDCSMAIGCWPATGMDLQGPFESCANCTHAVVDAFDIMDPNAHAEELKKLGVDMTKISNPAKIYSPFDGTACFPPYHSVYGNYVDLSVGEWHYWFGHMTSRIQDTGCKDVQAGEVIGLMGNTGTPGMAIHSHFELRTKDDSVNVGSDVLGTQMPPSLEGHQPPIGNLTNHVVDYVLSCYDQE